MKRKKRLMIFVFLLCAAAAVVVAVTYASDSVAARSEAYNGFSPQDFQNIELARENIYQGELILINASHPYRASDGEELASVYDLKNEAYLVKDTEVCANRKTILAVNDMLGDFYQKTGADDVNVISGYRSRELQAQLFEEKKAQTNEAEAARWVARPGASEHHSGYALDFGIYRAGMSMTFTGEGQYRRIAARAHEYGFILRYVPEKDEITGIAGEAWHFRYVGKPHAFYMKKKGMCLEEYIEHVKSYPYQNRHLIIRNAGGKKYAVYYVEAQGEVTNVPVPRELPYTVSGNNVDGFIVTTELQ